MSDWPHAPVHRLDEKGVYMVTCGTYLKQHHFGIPERLQLVQDKLFDVANVYGWRLQAWAIFSNHYHFVAGSPEDAASLRIFLSRLHTETAAELNRLDQRPGRRIWYEYYDSHITYQASYLARLRYVHQNPVHHHLARVASEYAWCSAAWLERVASPAFRKTLESFKTDAVRVVDDF